ncbi:MAG: HlyD family efflux transporter periplasmic adaptor subunit [Planctomycetota bacterium]|nr:MAG: HlyD family efflux transporter periplasmic adaptor subunit [Planctomycetota bacterium]
MVWRAVLYVGGWVATCFLTSPAWAQRGAGDEAKPESPALVAGRPVVIDRTPVLFRDPLKYQVNLHLAPTRQVTLAATVDGVVIGVLTQLGQAVPAQGEVLRLDSRADQLRVQRAAASLKAAKADLAAGGKGGAEARVQVAEADLALAELEANQASIRSPFPGQVVAIHVIDGEYIRAGQPLVTVIDPTQFFVEAPVDGRSTKPGDAIELQVEGDVVSAKVAVILPLTASLDSLRELFPSPATGRIILENPTGQWRSGQTVYSGMIPRQPVAEVPTTALRNAEQGGRQVQVIRDGFVRDVPVQLLGQIGADFQFVSGRFSSTDELVLKSSELIVDGARIVPRDPNRPATPLAPGNTGKNPQPGAPGRPAASSGNNF